MTSCITTASTRQHCEILMFCAQSGRLTENKNLSLETNLVNHGGGYKAKILPHHFFTTVLYFYFFLLIFFNAANGSTTELSPINLCCLIVQKCSLISKPDIISVSHNQLEMVHFRILQPPHQDGTDII